MKVKSKLADALRRVRHIDSCLLSVETGRGALSSHRQKDDRFLWLFVWKNYSLDVFLPITERERFRLNTPPPWMVRTCAFRVAVSGSRRCCNCIFLYRKTPKSLVGFWHGLERYFRLRLGSSIRVIGRGADTYVASAGLALLDCGPRNGVANSLAALRSRLIAVWLLGVYRLEIQSRTGRMQRVSTTFFASYPRSANCITTWVPSGMAQRIRSSEQ